MTEQEEDKPKSIEDIKKIVAKENPKNLEELADIMKNQLSKMPHIEENVKKMIQIRGSIIEMSIELESLFNEIILLTNKQDMIIDSFKNKADFIKIIIKKIDTLPYRFDKSFFDKLDDVVIIRNLFAHVPEDFFSERLTFRDAPPYDRFKKVSEFKDIPKTLTYVAPLFQKLKEEFESVFKMLAEYLDNNQLKILTL